MRLPLALAAAAAYLAGRPDPAPRPAPGAGSEPSIVEPWRSPGIPETPDPIALFLLSGLKADAGTLMPAAEVATAYQRWAEQRGIQPGDQAAVIERLDDYTRSHVVAGNRYFGPAFLRLFGQGAPARRTSGLTLTLTEAPARPLPARAIPGLRARILADSALVVAELAGVLQATRDVLEPAIDAEGGVGEAVRIAAGMIDDALADFASDTPDHRTA